MTTAKSYLLKDLLSHISDNTDKTKGSITYEALVGTLFQINEYYKNLLLVENEMYGNTQSMEFLTYRALERGITRKLNTHAIMQIEFNVNVSIGERFTLNDLTYEVIEHIDGFTYKALCEEKGSFPNNILGEATPINYIENLNSSIITKCLIPARDEESLEDFRARYLDSFGILPYGGNKKDYFKMAEEIDGVFSIKVIRSGNGPGTTIIYVLDNDLKKPTNILLNYVKEILDPKEHEGYGYGLLPIGHKCEVLPCIESFIDITLNIEFKSTANIDDTKKICTNNINIYFDDIKRNWHKTSGKTVIRKSFILEYILKNSDVIDVNKILINELDENFEINIYSIPVLRNIEFLYEVKNV